MEKDIKDTNRQAMIVILFGLTLVISLMMNFNLIGALILRGKSWILENWLNGMLLYLLPIYYVLVHFGLILSYITIKKK
jgi:hypothetical protein